MYPEEFEIPSVMTFDDRADLIKDYIRQGQELGLTDEQLTAFLQKTQEIEIISEKQMARRKAAQKQAEYKALYSGDDVGMF
jgi:hypothetical protein